MHPEWRHRTGALLATSPARSWPRSATTLIRPERRSNSQLLPPTWGPARTRTRPSVGTHDYGDIQGGSLTGYTDYFATTLSLFGPSASDPSRAYYSYDIGAWHVVVINAACYYYAPGCSEPGQEQWLRADLASRPAPCTLPTSTTRSSRRGRSTRAMLECSGTGRPCTSRRRPHPQRPQPPVRAVCAADPNGQPIRRYPRVRGRNRRRGFLWLREIRRTARFGTPARTG